MAERRDTPSRSSQLDPGLPQAADVHTFGKFLSATEHERARRRKLTRFAGPKLLDTPGPGSYSISSSFEAKPVRKKGKFMSVRLPVVPTCQPEPSTNSCGLSVQGLVEDSPQKLLPETRPTPSHEDPILACLVRPPVHIVGRSAYKTPYQKLSRAGQFSMARLKPTSESRRLYERFESGLSELKMVGQQCNQATRKRIRVLRNHPLKARSVTRLAISPEESALPKVRGLQLRRSPWRKAPHVVVLPKACVYE